MNNRFPGKTIHVQYDCDNACDFAAFLQSTEMVVHIYDMQETAMPGPARYGYTPSQRPFYMMVNDSFMVEWAYLCVHYAARERELRPHRVTGVLGSERTQFLRIRYTIVEKHTTSAHDIDWKNDPHDKVEPFEQDILLYTAQ